MRKNTEKVQILDTTLRDGEQMENVSYSPDEKLAIARVLLENVKVHRIEVASARVSEGEGEAVRHITEWAQQAGFADKIEILGFVDHKKSVDWICEYGGKVMNLLAKGSLKHLEKQLKKTKEQHVKDIRRTVDYAISRGVRCNLYLEDWSNGMIDSPDYVYFMLQQLVHSGISRFMLPDTLGILYPSQVRTFVSDLLQRFPELEFDFHGHNDYGLAVANALASIEAGIRCVHCTVNGMGERAGNTPLDETVIGIHDFFHLDTGIDETQLFRVSQLVEAYSGCRVGFNKPISGSNVFTQTAGVHADGDRKGELYQSRLRPERVGRVRKYALGKLSGKSNLDYHLEKLRISLDSDQKQRVLERIVELGDRKEVITEDDLPFIISDVLDSPQDKIFHIQSAMVVSNTDLKPLATVRIVYRDPSKEEEMVLEDTAQGDGGYDAFMNAVRKIISRIHFSLPQLVDYSVTIPPGGKTDALVRCVITWENKTSRFITKGVNSDQVMAAIEATEKMLNIVAIQKKAQKV